MGKKKKYIERAGELKAKYKAQMQRIGEAGSSTGKAPDKKASKIQAIDKRTKVGAGSSKAFSKKATQARSLRQLLLGETGAASVASATPKGTKERKVAKDVKRPKKPLGAYYIWLRGARSKIVASLPIEDRKKSARVNKAAGARWRSMSKRSKEAYQKKSKAAAEEYDKALAKYEAMET